MNYTFYRRDFHTGKVEERVLDLEPEKVAVADRVLGWIGFSRTVQADLPLDSPPKAFTEPRKS